MMHFLLSFSFTPDRTLSSHVQKDKLFLSISGHLKNDANHFEGRGERKKKKHVSSTHSSTPCRPMIIRISLTFFYLFILCSDKWKGIEGGSKWRKYSVWVQDRIPDFRDNPVFVENRECQMSKATVSGEMLCTQ